MCCMYVVCMLCVCVWVCESASECVSVWVKINVMDRAGLCLYHWGFWSVKYIIINIYFAMSHNMQKLDFFGEILRWNNWVWIDKKCSCRVRCFIGYLFITISNYFYFVAHSNLEPISTTPPPAFFHGIYYLLLCELFKLWQKLCAQATVA